MAADYKPTSKGRIHDVFNDLIDGVAARCGLQHEHERGGPARPWGVPDGVASVLDPAGITGAFDRAAIDANYDDCMTKPSAAGTVADAISLKTQGDYVATMERAFRARHCTPVRLLGFAAARRRGHASANGVLKGGVLRYAQDVLKAGR